MNQNKPFHQKYDLETRKKEAERIKEKYPNKLPVIIEQYKSSKIKKIEKSKFLVPDELTIAQLLIIIRKRLSLKQTEAIFLFTENILPPTTQTISSLYSEYKNEDGFLYLKYCNENVFGLN